MNLAEPDGVVFLQDQMQLTSGQIAAVLQHFQNYRTQLSRTSMKCQASAQELQVRQSTYDRLILTTELIVVWTTKFK